MYHYDVVIIGSGAAGYAAADRLLNLGIQNIAMFTENRYAGTSRNAGSDKQTYYKLSCTDSDSPQRMAADLSFGGGMHGDTALIEAANSLRCFYHLVEYGVAFPQDRLGRFIGYQTDHDSASRGTSIGPLTSRRMTECLERQVLGRPGLTCWDHTTVIQIVTYQNQAMGLIALQQLEGNQYQLLAVRADQIIMATGGAAGIYQASAYPFSQSGALGLAVSAGCILNNLTEWQYGIASVKIRWNLSGSYQQVIPRYFSLDAEGTEREFLLETLGSEKAVCSLTFLKGYQWPFDGRKINGSSQIDLAVQEQINQGRRVFLDFRKNPEGYVFSELSEEARTYLEKAGALGETPYARLMKLNPRAVEFYRSHGCDLSQEPLEIAVCAQHMNGGVDVDCSWQTSVTHLYAVGEIAGTFGLYRPGGSALNSTQVGALRAASAIAKQLKARKDTEQRDASPRDETAEAMLRQALHEEEDYIRRCSGSHTPMTDYRTAMSASAAFLREYEQLLILDKALDEQKERRYYRPDTLDYPGIRRLYQYRDTLSAQSALCKTLLQTMTVVGSRGGAVCFQNGNELPENPSYRKMAIHTQDGVVSYVPLRPIPDTTYHFETIWNETDQ